MALPTISTGRCVLREWIDSDREPCIEITWRFSFGTWSNGYACEAALAALSFGFTTEIVAFTAFPNHRSRRLMERIGMEYSPSEDFHHPNLPPEHHLSFQALYRLKRQNFRREGLCPKMDKTE